MIQLFTQTDNNITIKYLSKVRHLMPNKAARYLQPINWDFSELYLEKFWLYVSTERNQKNTN